MGTGNIETRSHNQRAEDQSLMLWIRDKILPPIIIAGVLGGLTGGWIMYNKIASVTDSIPKMNEELAIVRESIPTLNLEVKRLNDKIDTEFARMNDNLRAQEARITVVESQMVGWDVMKRIEMGMNAASREGKGDASLRAISAAIRSEVEARKERATKNDRR